MSEKVNPPCTAECPDRRVDCHVEGHCAMGRVHGEAFEREKNHS